MILKKIVVEEAVCDACGKSFVCPMPPNNVNYGELTACFGYGSRLDDPNPEAKKRQVCEDCWEKALKAIGLEAN